MKKVKTIIKFDGPALSDKSMDVSELAPALISLSDVFKLANNSFNGDKSAIKILVNADIEQNCFELSLKVAQTIWNHVGNLLAEDNVKTAKEIAEWVGIIATSSISLFGLIKALKGQKVSDTVVVKQENGTNNIQITIEGNNNSINVSPQVFQLYTNKEIRKKAVAVLNPLKFDGYESMEFYEGNKIFEIFTSDDVPSSYDEDLPDILPSNELISIIRTSVRIKKPAYEGKSKWMLVYLKAIEAPIEDFEWLLNFQSNKVSAPPNSSLVVDLEQKVIVNERGEALEEPTYRVLNVHDVILPPHQLDLF